MKKHPVVPAKMKGFVVRMRTTSYEYQRDKKNDQGMKKRRDFPAKMIDFVLHMLRHEDVLPPTLKVVSMAIDEAFDRYII